MIELMDLVDKDDNVIGVVDRATIYSQGLHNYRVVGVLVFNSKGQLLLQKRSTSCNLFPSKLDLSCGGHVLSGEDYLTAAKRELKEELFVDVDTLEQVLYIKYPNSFGISNFVMYYALSLDNIQQFDKVDIESIFWQDVQEVYDNVCNNADAFLPNFAKLMQNHKQLVQQCSRKAVK